MQKYLYTCLLFLLIIFVSGFTLAAINEESSPPMHYSRSMSISVMKKMMNLYQYGPIYWVYKVKRFIFARQKRTAAVKCLSFCSQKLSQLNCRVAILNSSPKVGIFMSKVCYCMKARLEWLHPKFAYKERGWL